MAIWNFHVVETAILQHNWYAGRARENEGQNVCMCSNNTKMLNKRKWNRFLVLSSFAFAMIVLTCSFIVKHILLLCMWRNNLKLFRMFVVAMYILLVFCLLSLFSCSCLAFFFFLSLFDCDCFCHWNFDPICFLFTAYDRSHKWRIS